MTYAPRPRQRCGRFSATWQARFQAPDPLIVAEKNDRYIVVDPGDARGRGKSQLHHLCTSAAITTCSAAACNRPRRCSIRTMFLRIHRSVIINTRHIREMARQLYGDYEVTLANGTKSTSGRAYRRRVVNYINSGRL